MAPTVKLTPVVIWYAHKHDGVEIRVRTYAGTKAVEESSVLVSDADLAKVARANGHKVWDETDVAAIVHAGAVDLRAATDPKNFAEPVVHSGAVWSGHEDGLKLVGADPAFMPPEAPEREDLAIVPGKAKGRSTKTAGKKRG